MTAGGRKTDHVLKSVYRHAQKDKEEDMMKFASKYRSEISGWNLVEFWGNFYEKIFKFKKNSFNKRLCTITCKAFINALLQEKRRFYHKPPFSGLDGSRTRVRNTIPCPSTSVVYYLTFPLPHDNKQPCGFSSFMIRPMAQSFANVVSHIVEAWVLKCECSRSDCCH